LKTAKGGAAAVDLRLEKPKVGQPPACPSLPYTPTYTYDAEGHLRGTGGVNYTYDGDGNRVIKSNGTLYWGIGSLAESDLSGSTASWKDYIFFNGRRIAKRDSTTTHYFFSDHLGSASVIRNDTSGTLEEDLVYSPYGAILTGTSADHYMFTGKERDSESGLDNFGKRYNGSSLGRFTTPDPMGILKQKLIDPQQWNMYSYSRNNPVRFTDPTGMYVCRGTTDECARIKTAYDTAQKALAAATPKSEQYKQIKSVLDFLGKPGKANGVAVTFGKLDPGTTASTDVDPNRNQLGTKNPITTIKFDLNQIDAGVRISSGKPLYPTLNDDAGVLIHEGTHGRDHAPTGQGSQSKAEAMATERNAYRNEGYIYDLLGVKSYINSNLTNPTISREQAIEDDAKASVKSEGW